MHWALVLAHLQLTFAPFPVPGKRKVMFGELFKKRAQLASSGARRHFAFSYPPAGAEAVAGAGSGDMMEATAVEHLKITEYDSK